MDSVLQKSATIIGYHQEKVHTPTHNDVREAQVVLHDC